MGLQDSEASKGTHEPGGDFVFGRHQTSPSTMSCLFRASRLPEAALNPGP